MFARVLLYDFYCVLNGSQNVVARVVLYGCYGFLDVPRFSYVGVAMQFIGCF